MRQARRSFRHLPPELHDQGFDQAGLTLRTSAPSGMDRRALYADLARHLDDELRQIHVGWCLNQAQVPAEAPPSETGPSAQQPIASFIEDGLGGLERAVLQLELGAGRDTSTVRAALRLGPNQYARHREMGLGKLRGAITGSLRGRVCDQHLDAVTLAATGDRGAADRLASGPGRCRACAREASGLRRVLQQRLALAPWPFVIKPAGAIAAKLGALGAVVSGKGAGGLGAGFGAASGAKVVAGVVAAAANTAGSIAAVESGDPKKGAAPAAQAVGDSASAAAQQGNRAPAAVPAAGGTAARRSRAAAKRKRTRRDEAAAVATATAQTQAQKQHPTSPEPAGQSKPSHAVRKAIDSVKKTVDDVTGTVAPKVDEMVPGAGQAVDDVTGTVDDLLAP